MRTGLLSCAALGFGMLLSGDAWAQVTHTSVPLRTVYDHPLLQKKVSLTLKDADINKAVEELSKAAGVSLVVERVPAHRGKALTLQLSDARLADVLDAIGRLYSYRWSRRGEVFFLIFNPADNASKSIEQLMKDAANEIYSTLTPEQREKLRQQGSLSGKELSPGQQGVVWGYLMEMASRGQSMAFSFSDLSVDPEKVRSG